LCHREEREDVLRIFLIRPEVQRRDRTARTETRPIPADRLRKRKRLRPGERANRTYSCGSHRESAAGGRSGFGTLIPCFALNRGCETYLHSDIKSALVNLCLYAIACGEQFTQRRTPPRDPGDAAAGRAGAGGAAGAALQDLSGNHS